MKPVEFRRKYPVSWASSPFMTHENSQHPPRCLRIGDACARGGGDFSFAAKKNSLISGAKAAKEGRPSKHITFQKPEISLTTIKKHLIGMLEDVGKQILFF